jgi:hypothetical protein
MLAKPEAPQIPLPKGWQGCVKSAVVHVISLAHYAIVYARAWAAGSDRQGITPRFGAVGQHGSIAIVERFILSLKNECTRVIAVSLRRESFCRELAFFADWHRQHRAHSGLNGKTPHEVYHDLLPSCERPRYEPRARWLRSAPCAFPQVPVAGHYSTRIRLDVRYHRERKHLPIVALRHAA